MTLLLYKPGKPKLALDMSLIAAFQIAALGYGFYATHQQRTVAIVYAEQGFHTLSAQASLEADQALRKLNVEPQPLPKVALLNPPLLLTPDAENLGKYLEDMFNGYPGPSERSDQFVPLAAHQDSMQKSALSMADIEDAGASEAIEHALHKRSLAANNVEFYKFYARYANGIAIFDPSELRILDYVTYESPTAPSEILDVAEDASE